MKSDKLLKTYRKALNLLMETTEHLEYQECDILYKCLHELTEVYGEAAKRMLKNETTDGEEETWAE